MTRTTREHRLQHVAGDERTYLELLIEQIEIRSENHRANNQLVSAAECMQTTHFLRRLLPPASRLHERQWNNGDLFPGGKGVTVAWAKWLLAQAETGTEERGHTQ
jgi:hypothetical protein